MRRCPDCKRTLPDPVIVADASPELKLFFQQAAKVCRWCASINLLSGGFEPHALLPLFSEEEQVVMRRKASELAHAKIQHWRARRDERELRRAAQGRLVGA